MITITRKLARRLKTVFRRAGSINRHRPPNVVFEADRTGLLIRCRIDPVLVEHHVPGDFSSEVLTIPFDALADLEGRGETIVLLKWEGNDTVVAEWQDGEIPQRRTWEFTDPSAVPKPEPPAEIRTNDPSIITRLAEAMNSTAPEGSRYALDCIQLKNTSETNQGGQVVATDGRQALLADGFEFPWEGEVLVPRTGVFGCKEIAGEQEVAIGRTDEHVVFTVGPWRFWLQIEKDTRFPEVARVLPSPESAKTHVQFAPEDARFLVRAIPKLPLSDDDGSPVTVDLNGLVIVRALGNDDGPPTELILTNSKVTGEPIQFNTDRNYLRKAAEFGSVDLYVFGAKSAILCTDPCRRYTWMPLATESVIETSEDAIRIESGDFTPPETKTKPKLRKKAKGKPMPRETTNRKIESAQNNETPSSDPIAALIGDAESLKQILRDAVSRTNDLVTSIKQHRKRAKTVENTLSALRQLEHVA